VKGAWTKVEDDLIMELVAKHGPTKWSMIAQSLPGRIGKQCRERQVLSSNMNVISHFSLCSSTYSPLDSPFAQLILIKTSLSLNLIIPVSSSNVHVSLKQMAQSFESQHQEGSMVRTGGSDFN
jgi:hypothetical protein